MPSCRPRHGNSVQIMGTGTREEQRQCLASGCTYALCSSGCALHRIMLRLVTSLQGGAVAVFINCLTQARVTLQFCAITASAAAAAILILSPSQCNCCSNVRALTATLMHVMRCLPLISSLFHCAIVFQSRLSTSHRPVADPITGNSDRITKSH